MAWDIIPIAWRSRMSLQTGLNLMRNMAASLRRARRTGRFSSRERMALQKFTLQVPKGGLYRIDTCMDLADTCGDWSVRGDCVYHVGVGDVFVIAGQSNSAGYGKDFISDAPEAGVHLLKNSGCWDIAAHHMNDSTDTLHPHNRDGANTGHSPYLSFGKYLKRELGYPIGLVQTSLGGSPLSAWSGEEGSLCRSMLNVVKKLNGIKGILWYQGCSDTCSPCGSR